MKHCARVLIVLCAALTAAAQEVVTRIEVELNCAPPLPRQIALILNGDDRRPNVLTETNGVYAKHLTDPLPVEDLKIASVRLGDGRRTGCKARPRLNRTGIEYTAYFEFRCTDEKPWPGLRVEPVQRNRITYLRVLSDDDPETVDCALGGSFQSGSIESFVPDEESIFLHIGAFDPKAHYTTWHMLIENGKYAKRPIGEHTRQLGRATIAAEYVIRRGLATARNAADILQARLPADFKHITLDRE